MRELIVHGKVRRHWLLHCTMGGRARDRRSHTENNIQQRLIHSRYSSPPVVVKGRGGGGGFLRVPRGGSHVRNTSGPRKNTKECKGQGGGGGKGREANPLLIRQKSSATPFPEAALGSAESTRAAGIIFALFVVHSYSEHGHSGTKRLT